jgi:hypothetical protein
MAPTEHCPEADGTSDPDAGIAYGTTIPWVVAGAALTIVFVLYAGVAGGFL